MVDQGQKGYCVVATAARIFAYYGMDYVDQHELASLANTSADGGTNTAAMAENLKKSGRASRYGSKCWIPWRIPVISGIC